MLDTGNYSGGIARRDAWRGNGSSLIGSYLEYDDLAFRNLIL